MHGVECLLPHPQWGRKDILERIAMARDKTWQAIYSNDNYLIFILDYVTPRHAPLKFVDVEKKFMRMRFI